MDRFFNRSINSDSRIREKRPKLPNLNQTQNRRRYVNFFENGSQFIRSLKHLNLNNPKLTVFIVFKMTDISFENQKFANSDMGDFNRKINAKFITFYKTFGGLGLLISKAHGSDYVAIANDSNSSIPKPDMNFPSSK